MAVTSEQKYTRMNSLTTAIQADIDALAADIATIQAAIDQATSDITDVTAQIAVLTAIPSGSRTEAQKVDLNALRRDKNILQSLKSILGVVKAQRRDSVRLARMVMLLDGSRVRDSDVTGTE